MDIQTHKLTPTSPARGERRTNHALRERFEAARTLLMPVLAGPEAQNGTALYRALNRLHTTYPELSGSELEALVASVARSLQQRKPKTDA